MLPTHRRYDYSIIGDRRDYNWPEGKRLAFCVVTNVEHCAKGIGWDPTKLTSPRFSLRPGAGRS